MFLFPIVPSERTTYERTAVSPSLVTPTELPIENLETIAPIDALATTTEQAHALEKESLYCSCVRYLRERWNVLIRGDASTIIPNKKFSEVSEGDVILFQYGEESHAAVITQFASDGWWIREANKIRCKETTRKVRFEDENIKGFYSPSVVQ